MKIYVASSWRNNEQPAVVAMLRDMGHEVYDFKNPREGDNGFHWSEIDRGWQDWSIEDYMDALENPIAEAGFKSDMDAMKWADAFVGVMPFGRSASLEMGWAAGQGKLTALLLSDAEPELMVKMLVTLCADMTQLAAVVTAWGDPHGDEVGDDTPELCADCRAYIEEYGAAAKPSNLCEKCR